MLLLSAVFLVVWISASGCGIKTKIKVDVPQGIRQAKTASHEELLEILRTYDKVNNLSCNEVELTFTSSQKIDNGTRLELDKYKAVGGYILLKRPDSVHLVIKAPIVNSTLLDVVSVGDDFSAWSPRENKLYEGKNSAKELMMEGPSGEQGFHGSNPRFAYFRGNTPSKHRSGRARIPGWFVSSKWMGAPAITFCRCKRKSNGP